MTKRSKISFKQAYIYFMDCVGVIDSGFGGLSTLSCLLNVLKGENFVYIADKSCSPYGNKSEDFILSRICYICDYLRDLGAKAIVLACNTATSCSIEHLRARNDGIFYVGVEPPIKPACEELRFGKALVLLTKRTSMQPKFLTLKERFLDKLIISVQPNLATLIEQNIDNLHSIKPHIHNIRQQFSHENIESIALGCTHYCLIKNQLLSTFHAKIYDSNVGTAIRLYSLLSQSHSLNRSGNSIKFLHF